MDEPAISTPILKRCGSKHPTKHPQGLQLPLSEFFRSKNTKDGLSSVCKQCQYDARRRMEQRSRGVDAPLANEPDGTVDPKFILKEALALYQDPGSRLEQKIKLLELMAKYSPEMKNAKPQDKVALMAAMMESLAKEKVTDAITTTSNNA